VKTMKQTRASAPAGPAGHMRNLSNENTLGLPQWM
jgi:hypothetical protein